VTQPFRPDELTGADGAADQADLAAALDVARLIERSVGADGVRPTPGFSDRVMAAVATQPAPHRSRLAALAGVLRMAVQTTLNANRPPLARARALAIVLAALIALGSIGGAATLAAAGALNLFQPHPSSGPLLTPHPQLSPSHDPNETHDPGRSPEPTESVGPSETPEPTETSEPGDTPEPTASDHHGGSDGSGDGGGKGTPGPSRTLEPRETPEPTGSPEPSDN
jgi:hypothetical protein